MCVLRELVVLHVPLPLQWTVAYLGGQLWIVVLERRRRWLKPEAGLLGCGCSYGLLQIVYLHRGPSFLIKKLVIPSLPDIP